MQSVTVFMVVAISAERHRAICHPLSLRQKPAKYIAFVLFLSFTLELPKWFEFKVRWERTKCKGMKGDFEYVRVLDRRSRPWNRFSSGERPFPFNGRRMWLTLSNFDAA